MNAFIEQNKRLLKFYCLAARIVGLLLLLLCGICVVMFFTERLAGPWKQSIIMQWPVGTFQRGWLIFLGTGLAALGVGQFIRYLFDNQYQGGWLLNHGDKILYIFVIVVMWQAVKNFSLSLSGYLGRAASLPDGNPYSSAAILSNPYEHLFLAVLPVLLLNMVKMLALIGMAEILRRVMVSVRESRTLV